MHRSVERAQWEKWQRVSWVSTAASARLKASEKSLYRGPTLYVSISGASIATLPLTSNEFRHASLSDVDLIFQSLLRHRSAFTIHNWHGDFK